MEKVEDNETVTLSEADLELVTDTVPDALGDAEPEADSLTECGGDVVNDAVSDIDGVAVADSERVSENVIEAVVENIVVTLDVPLALVLRDFDDETLTDMLVEVEIEPVDEALSDAVRLPESVRDVDMLCVGVIDALGLRLLDTLKEDVWLSEADVDGDVVAEIVAELLLLVLAVKDPLWLADALSDSDQLIE